MSSCIQSGEILEIAMDKQTDGEFGSCTPVKVDLTGKCVRGLKTLTCDIEQWFWYMIHPHKRIQTNTQVAKHDWQMCTKHGRVYRTAYCGTVPLYYLLCIILMWLWSYNSGECVIVWMVTSLTSSLQRWFYIRQIVCDSHISWVQLIVAVIIQWLVLPGCW